MGTGKTVVGRALGQLSGYPLIDTDNVIETMSGQTIPSLFKDKGEAHFRAMESQLCQTLSDNPPSIITTGGGFPIPDSQQLRLKEMGTIVYLYTPLKTIETRLKESYDRPLWQNKESITELYQKRDPTYRSLAHHQVHTEDNSVEEIAKVVWSLYNSK